MSFRLETTVKGFHFWIVFSALQRIGEAQAIHQEQLSAPLITGKDRILIMMQDHLLIGDIILPKGRFSSLPSLQCQGGIPTLAYSPSIHHLAVKVLLLQMLYPFQELLIIFLFDGNVDFLMHIISNYRESKFGQS